MTADNASSVGQSTLPSGPASLCFDKEEFMKSTFNVDKFVMECRRRVPMETLRDDLGIYLKILRNAMIELINKDYADFVNLSTNLVGMDRAINHLTVPLGQLKEEVLSVQNAMNDAIQAVEERIRYRDQVKEKKASLQCLMNITKSVEKIEQLLNIQFLNETQGEHVVDSSRHLSGQLIERVATEFNKLQFYVTKSRGLPLVERIKPRIAYITTTLQYSLEGSFLDGVQQGNVDILRQCLRTYALIDKISDVEYLFRLHVVRPYLEEVINEQSLQANVQGLQGLYTQVLHFIPSHCKLAQSVTTGSAQGSDVVRGYDFLVNSVWPEIVSNIEARIPSIFAPGNPNSFYQKYSISMDFLDKFEKLCGSKASVLRLREHPSYNIFMTKWSLPVYFQIRYQEIAGSFETSLLTPFNKTDDNEGFHLHATASLWRNINMCWSDGIYLPLLCHRFWKLTLQLLSRYSEWVASTYQQEIEKFREGGEKSLTNSTAAGGEKITDSTSAQSDQPNTHPVTQGQIICLIADAQVLANKIEPLFGDIVKPKLASIGFENPDMIYDCIVDCRSNIHHHIPQFRSYLIVDITAQCAVCLRQVSDIPRLYRRTNRELPSKASTYINSLVRPLKLFVDEHTTVLGTQQQEELVKAVFKQLAEQYYSVTSDVLMSVRKMEDSLKRLKKARGTGTNASLHGVTDDDKIRLQLIIDIDSYGEQMDAFHVNKTDSDEYQKLLELAKEAKAAMTTTAS